MKNKFFNSPWTISIGSSFIAGVLLYLINPTILLWIWSFIISVGNGILSVLTFGIPLYWVLIGIMVILILRQVLRGKALMEQTVTITTPRKPWNDYTKDVFYDVPYSWQWNEVFGTLEIRNIKVRCPKCNCEMISNMHYECPNCGKIIFSSLIKDNTTLKTMIWYRAHLKYPEHLKE